MTDVTNQKPGLGSTAGALLFLGLLIVLAGAIVWGFWTTITSLDSGVAAAVIAASATILVSVFSLIWSRRKEQQLAREEAHREHKRAVYEEFFDFWFTMFAPDAPEKTETEIQQFAASWTPKLLLWGSGEMLAAYGKFRATALLENADAKQQGLVMMAALEDLIFAIRKDLGHSNNGLKQADVLRLFINDIDDYINDEAA